MIRAFALLVACAAVPAAQACGVCIDDKVAATYDHALIGEALKHDRAVVFAEVKGAAGALERTRAARAAAARVLGVDPRTIRTSREPATLSFALDRGVSAEKALAAIERGAAGTRIELLKVLR
jgi:hypothetical protein